MHRSWLVEPRRTCCKIQYNTSPYSEVRAVLQFLLRGQYVNSTGILYGQVLVIVASYFFGNHQTCECMCTCERRLTFGHTTGAIYDR